MAGGDHVTDPVAHAVGHRAEPALVDHLVPRPHPRDRRQLLRPRRHHVGGRPVGRVDVAGARLPAEQGDAGRQLGIVLDVDGRVRDRVHHAVVARDQEDRGSVGRAGHELLDQPVDVPELGPPRSE